MRPIDADSVKRGIEELKQSPWYNEKNLDHFPIRKEAVEVVEHLCIDKEPTIDAVPVVHGHWVKCETADFNLCCSVCKNGYTDYKLSFCYDCGAKMDGGKDDDKR